MEDLDKPTMDNIFSFFALSPSCRDNGIACCNRRINIAWRQMNRLVMKRMLRNAYAHLLDLCSPTRQMNHLEPVDMLFILDLNDIV